MKTNLLNKALLNVFLTVKALFLWVENCFQSLWPAIFLIITYMALLNYGLDRHYKLHLAIFSLCCIVFIVILARFFRHYKLPKKYLLFHRLEKDSKLPHNPILTSQDHLASGNKKLWQDHLKQMKYPKWLSIPRIRLSVNPARDPYALRILVLLFFVLSFYFGDGRLFFDKLRYSFVPSVSMPVIISAEEQQKTVTGWITPPDYTNHIPVILNIDTPQPIIIPTGSKLSLQINRSYLFFRPSISLTEGQESFLNYDSENRLYQYETVIHEDHDEINVRLGFFDSIDWRIFVLEDEPPAIFFAHTPERNSDGQLSLHYTFHDDYGVDSVQLLITRAQSIPREDAPPEIETRTIDLPVKDKDIIDGQHSSTISHTIDMARHIWSGQPVSLQLIATDAIGQTSKSEAILFILPEREFRHPVAQELMQMRRALLANYPATRTDAIEQVFTYLNMPILYQNDFGLFLAISSLFNRLNVDIHHRQLHSISELIWDIALALDKDQIEREKEKIDKLLSDLLEALENNDTKALEQYLDQLEESLFEYQQALLEYLNNHAQDSAAIALPENTGLDALSDENIQSAMKQLRDLAMSGSKQDLKQALQHLKDYMAGLKKPQIVQMSPQQQQALQQLQDLDAVIKQQENIRSQTRLNTEQQKQERDNRLFLQQEGLTDFLQEIITQCQNAGLAVPNSLPLAHELMQEALSQLDQAAYSQAQDIQDEILSLLNDGMQDLAENIQQQMNMQLISSSGNPLMPQQGQRDPFGRAMSGGDRGTANNPLLPTGVKIPQQLDMRETQRIQNELRNRAGDRRRTEQELDYIRRLLNRF